METRAIGSLTVSVVGLGCNNFGMRCDETQSTAVVHAALDAGITFFDTADVYGALLGERADDVLRGPRATLGPPWGKDHRMALAATIMAG